MKSKAIAHIEKFNKEINCEKVIEKSNGDVNDMENIVASLMAGYGRPLKITPKEFVSKMSEKDAENMRHTFTMCMMIENWLEYKQIYKFDKDVFEMVSESECESIEFKDLKALKMPYDTFIIENEFEYGDQVADTIIVNKMEKDDKAVVMAYYFLKSDDGLAFQSQILMLDENEDIKLRDRDEISRKCLKMLYNVMRYLSQPKIEVLKKRIVNKKDTDKPVKSFYSLNYDENEVGYRLGNAIRNYRYVYEKGNALLNPSDKKRIIKPHIRCGHFHHYWTGKGRTELIVKYIEPTFVLGGTEKPTLHNVK